VVDGEKCLILGRRNYSERQILNTTIINIEVALDLVVNIRAFLDGRYACSG